MGAELPGDWRTTAVSALDWWHDAGVDVLVEDTARDWLARDAAPAAALSVATPAARPLPATLAEFVAWRAGDSTPEAGWRGVSVAASGPANAALMVLVDCPEAGEDCLLGGAAGRLFDQMLAAIGLTREAVYLAAVCGRRPVGGRLPRDVAAELHRLARHHIGLIAPPWLLLMGDGASEALLGRGVTPTRGTLQAVNHDRGQSPAVTTFHPRLLLDRPARKAEAWRDLQLLMGPS